MLIGEDFPKIKFDFIGLNLVEPNAFIGDSLILAVALYYYFKLKGITNQSEFTLNWRRFYLVFGVSFFLGGLGHLCYNYSGLPGKYPSWYTGMLAGYFLEMAMISLYPEMNLKRLFQRLALAKLILSILAASAVFILVDLSQDPSVGLRVPTLNSFIGLVFSLGYLGWKYARSINPAFRYMWISMLLLLPTVFVQTLKINIHPWMDRNDVSHILLIIGMLLYYRGIRGYLSANR